MHRPFDVAQRRASRTNARHGRVRGAPGQIEKNLTRPIAAVAKHATISSAYVFKLFPSKQGLFVAALEHAFGLRLILLWEDVGVVFMAVDAKCAPHSRDELGGGRRPPSGAPCEGRRSPTGQIVGRDDHDGLQKYCLFSSPLSFSCRLF